MAFTNEDLDLANALNVEIQQLQTDIALLEKINVPWNTDYPDSIISTKLVFHYQESGKDLKLVEVSPSDATIVSLRECLTSIKTRLEITLAAKELEFSQIGETAP